MVEIYQAILRMLEQGEQGALATIIHRRGSTPQKESAKMLIYADGRILGSIGGGCVENDVRQRAGRTILEGKPQLLDFDLTEDDIEGSGLVCGGKIQVYLEAIVPTPWVYIFGAGHVGGAICQAARQAGFRVTVVDDRPIYANRENFPMADEIVAEDWGEAFQKLKINESSYIVISTRGHDHDFKVLEWAAGTDAGYVGLLGSRRKVRLIFEELVARGVPPERIETIHAPIGLEIGAVTPEEIAVSIVAELIGVWRGASEKGGKFEGLKKRRPPQTWKASKSRTDPSAVETEEKASRSS